MTSHDDVCNERRGEFNAQIKVVSCEAHFLPVGGDVMRRCKGLYGHEKWSMVKMSRIDWTLTGFMEFLC